MFQTCIERNKGKTCTKDADNLWNKCVLNGWEHAKKKTTVTFVFFAMVVHIFNSHIFHDVLNASLKHFFKHVWPFGPFGPLAQCSNLNNRLRLRHPCYRSHTFSLAMIATMRQGKTYECLWLYIHIRDHTLIFPYLALVDCSLLGLVTLSRSITAKKRLDTNRAAMVGDHESTRGTTGCLIQIPRYHHVVQHMADHHVVITMAADGLSRSICWPNSLAHYCPRRCRETGRTWAEQSAGDATGDGSNSSIRLAVVNISWLYA